MIRKRRKNKRLWMFISLMLMLGMCVSVYAQEDSEWNKPPQKVCVTAQKGQSSTRKYTVYWKKIQNIDGYHLELYDSSKEKIFSKKIAPDRTSFQLNDIRNGKIYRLRICAFYEAENPYTGIIRNVYGPYHTEYLCQQPKIKFRWKNKNSVEVNWNPVENGVEYTVYLSEKRGGSYRKAAKSKTTQAVLKKLKMEKTYYVYVVARYRVNKKTYSTPVSGASSFRLQMK